MTLVVRRPYLSSSSFSAVLAWDQRIHHHHLLSRYHHRFLSFSFPWIPLRHSPTSLPKPTSIPGYLTFFNLNFNSCRLPWFRGSFWWAYFFGNRKPRVHRTHSTNAEFKTRIHRKSRWTSNCVNNRTSTVLL